MISRYIFNLSLGLNFSKNTFSLVIAISVFCFVFIAGLAKADLNTAPPMVSLIEQQQQNKTQIEGFIAKAYDAISKKFLTRPGNINAVYYAEQILLLSPDDKRVIDILTKVCDVYRAMAYRRLDENKIELAQRHYFNSIKIVRQFNLDFYHIQMASLQKEIAMRRSNINQIKAELKKSTKTNIFSSKIKQKPQEKPIIVIEEQLSLSEIQTLPRKIRSSFEKKQNTIILSKKSVLSPAERRQIVVIVNKRNKVSSLSLSELISLYKGNQKTWPNGETVTLYLPLVNSEAHLWLTQNVFLKKTSTAVTQFYMRGLNRYLFTTMPKTSTNSISDVSHIVGGIAIVTLGETEGHDSIKIVSIKGT